MVKKSKKVVVSLKRVWKTYHMGDKSIHAVHDTSLDIYEGEFVVVVGPSGSGKSTMMNLIGCLDTPSRGKIFLNGVDVSTLSESALAQIRGRTIGFIFQQFNLIPTLSAAENVLLPMTFQGVDRTIGMKKSRELLASLGLHERALHSPSELSGGERQRVAISRALANDPKLILADEPTGNLDSKTGRHVMEILNGIHSKGSTVVLVTHDMDLVDHAEKVVFIKDGSIAKITKQRKKR